MFRTAVTCSTGCRRFRISGFRYPPYRLDRVFSNVIPAIPTIPRYFEMSVPTILARSGIFKCRPCDTHDTPVFRDSGAYYTGLIRYFQMSYLRYPRVPRYGIPWGIYPGYAGYGTLPTVPVLGTIFKHRIASGSHYSNETIIRACLTCPLGC